jgi:hypothetical protein
LEEWGFCGWGEAEDVTADGVIGTRLPINTDGGPS